MDANITRTKKIAVDWRPVAAGLPDDSTLVLIAVNDDDVWTGFRDGDIWRYADAMPIRSERVTHWAHMPDPPGQEREAAPVELLPLNEQTRMILGRPNFACVFTAQRMRELGHKIKRTAQDEQAAVVHLLVNMYQQHGADWFEHVSAYLDRGQQAAAPQAAGWPLRSIAAWDLVADTMDHAQLQALGQQQKGSA